MYDIVFLWCSASCWTKYHSIKDHDWWWSWRQNVKFSISFRNSFLFEQCLPLKWKLGMWYILVQNIIIISSLRRHLLLVYVVIEITFLHLCLIYYCDFNSYIQGKFTFNFLCIRQKNVWIWYICKNESWFCL